MPGDWRSEVGGCSVRVVCASIICGWIVEIVDIDSITTTIPLHVSLRAGVVFLVRIRLTDDAVIHT